MLLRYSLLQPALREEQQAEVVQEEAKHDIEATSTSQDEGLATNEEWVYAEVEEEPIYDAEPASAEEPSNNDANNDIKTPSHNYQGRMVRRNGARTAEDVEQAPNHDNKNDDVEPP